MTDRAERLLIIPLVKYPLRGGQKKFDSRILIFRRKIFLNKFSQDHTPRKEEKKVLDKIRYQKV